MLSQRNKARKLALAKKKQQTKQKKAMAAKKKKMTESESTKNLKEQNIQGESAIEKKKEEQKEGDPAGTVDETEDSDLLEQEKMALEIQADMTKKALADAELEKSTIPSGTAEKPASSLDTPAIPEKTTE